MLAALLSSVITRKHKERERIITSLETFKDSFIPTVQIINKTPKIPADFENFTTHFTTQESAMYAFRSNLKGNNLISFDEKWKEYQRWHQECHTYDRCVANVCMNGHEMIALINEIIEIAKKV